MQLSLELGFEPTTFRSLAYLLYQMSYSLPWLQTGKSNESKDLIYHGALSKYR